MFEVGDILIGNKENRYAYTSKGTLVEVLKTETRECDGQPCEILTVRIADGRHEGGVFPDVEAQYFSFIGKPKEATVDLLSVYK